MLKRMLAGEGHSWGLMVPYVLFAYREVPRESTGFSPFELIYSRDVRCERTSRSAQREMEQWSEGDE